MEMNRYKIEIKVDYDEGLEKRYLRIETTDDRNTVAENIERAEIVMNTCVWSEYDSYEEYYEDYYESPHPLLTKEEFETMESCFDGYNEDTFECYLRERYGYKTETINKGCDFEITIH